MGFVNSCVVHFIRKKIDEKFTNAVIGQQGSTVCRGHTRPFGQAGCQEHKRCRTGEREFAPLRSFLFEQSARMESSAPISQHSVFIGAQSYMNDSGIVRDRVFIGRYCSIGRRVSIAAGAHYMTGVSTNPAPAQGPAEAFYSADEMEALEFSAASRGDAPTILQADVWVGDGAVVMPGVVVGAGAVIGANVVVTKDVAPYSIVAGSPARHIRFRFPERVRERLLQSQWWDLSLETLKAFQSGNVLSFLDEVEALNTSETHFADCPTLAIGT